MMNQILVDADEYLGAVKIDSKWRIFHDVLGMWILDYSAYDDYVPKLGGWREGIMKVDQNNAAQYCRAMEAKEIPPQLIPDAISVLGGQMPLTFVVNFDDRFFVNGWHDNIAIHEYVPDGWKGISDNPYKHIPQELKARWSE
jgi:hypothetical protein